MSARPISRRVSPTYAALAAQLRAERERQGLTQRELARRIEDYSTSLCQWERGGTVPGIAPLAKWATGLGLKLTLTPIAAECGDADLAAATARAQTAKAEVERLRVDKEAFVRDIDDVLSEENLDAHGVSASIQAAIRRLSAHLFAEHLAAEAAETENDRLRARIAELGEPEVQWAVWEFGRITTGSEHFARVAAFKMGTEPLTREVRRTEWRPADATPAPDADGPTADAGGTEAGAVNARPDGAGHGGGETGDV